MRIAIITAIIMLIACEDAPLGLVEIECAAYPCIARWEGTDLWSPVYRESELASMPEVSSESLWECSDGLDPDLVTCVVVDANGHVGCFLDQGDWVVAVAPSCATSTSAEWLDIGCDMSAWATTN